LGQILAIALGRFEICHIAFEFAGEQAFVLRIPTSAWQPTWIKHGLEGAFAQGDHLATVLLAVLRFANVLALDGEISGQFRVGGIGENFVGRYHHHTSSEGEQS
jgi:hypothetical protein